MIPYFKYPCHRKMRNLGRLFLSYNSTRSFHAPQRFSIHRDKDCYLPCASVALRLGQMPDIILLRDCIAISFLTLQFSCFPIFHNDTVQ